MNRLHYYLGERPKGSRAGRCMFFGRLQTDAAIY